MKTPTVSILSFIALSLVNASAGVFAPSFSKQPIPTGLNVPSICDCFRANTATVSAYAAGLVSTGGGGEYGKGKLDGSFGGGIALDYFFTENVGISGDATWLAEDSAVHLFTASVILRAPIKSACLSPYIALGGGLHADGVTQGVLHAGGGVDFRIANCWGVFADARYTWATESEDYTVLRGGVRFNF